jgi:plasmid stabilization system protein ParE
MVQTIIWNKKAQNSFDQIMNYLHDEYSKNTAEKFFMLVYHRIGQLTNQPYIGRPTKKTKTVRQINVDKYRKMYYRIEGRTLIISDFFDVRQDPAKERY